MGSPVELVRDFGKQNDFENAVKELENEIYNIA
jgi:type I restriction enzyme R subunit